MGYNAVSTDPLYKHIHSPSPAAMTLASACFMTTSQLLAGSGQRDRQLPHRLSPLQAEAGDIDYYLFTGERVLDTPKPSYA